ncbi:hypothetical protein KIMH_02630 [Bombiscardovia apis]|uniref:Gram-positive pilin subunit D1 N-terminal domain-containing protein n=1 Tax=Bombiscardovia apis TaxID=2932182 RepID=A0ABM8BB70_9BIFI|nr:SpaH/EbpB family LPXTG-anchored major pilin [Bombiscardovia apis]BDR54152.1 hypothetical protein KIMH_02630 [Bombiscardovia apis]
MVTNKNHVWSKTALTGVLALSLLGLGAALPSVAHADTFNTTDNFIAGKMQTNQPVSLTITKYKQTDAGVTPTGSSQDAQLISAGSTPLQGVEFSLFPITLDAGCKASDLKITSTNTAGTATAPTVNCGTVGAAEKTGITDGNGVLKWDWANFSKVNYYVLQETNKPTGVTVSQPNLFGLPFFTTNTGNVAGYVYNLSVFPKNLTSNQINKSVVGSNIAQVGNQLTYTLSENIYDASKGINPTGNTTGAAVAGDGYLDVSEINGTTTQPQVRISDRLSSSLSVTGKPKVSWECAGGASTDLVEGTDYTATTSTDDPKRIPANEDAPLFADGNSGAGVNFMTVDLWPTPAAANSFKTAIASCPAQVRVTVVYVATVTAAGDSAAGAAGTLQNTANADVFDGTPGKANPEGAADVRSSSAGFNFVKTDTTSAVGLEGAEFRLSDPSDPTSFLLQDGTFANTGNFVTATSNNKGIVTFTALPLFKDSNFTTDANGNSILPDDTVADSPWLTAASAGKLNLVEVAAPKGYQAPSTDFGSVDFSKYVGKTAKDIAAFGSIVPEIDTNIFGATYSADSAIVNANFKDANNKPISVGMKNFTPAEAPIGLPLTGSQGILIFLVLGLAVVGITLYVRFRISKAQATTR